MSDVFHKAACLAGFFSYCWTYIKKFPGCFCMSRLPAAVFNPLVSDNEVIPLAADLFNRKNVPLGGHLLLDTLEELRALPSLVQAPAATDGLDQTQNSFGGEIWAGENHLLWGSRGHRWSFVKNRIDCESFSLCGVASHVDGCERQMLKKDAVIYNWRPWRHGVIGSYMNTHLCWGQNSFGCFMWQINSTLIWV